MTLLNGLLAFGAAAFTIPLIIHLLHRSRYRTIEWGAMHLLQASKNLNSRRMQWQQLLLLLLRCALPVLLALAMSRPLLQSFGGADGQAAISLAIIIDDSMSMFATSHIEEQKAKTLYAVACNSAAEILTKLPAGSNSLVLLGGAKADALQGQIPDDLSTKLNELANRTVPAGDLGLQESIRDSLTWLATSQNPRRQIIILSDFQKHEWATWGSEQASELAKQIADQSIPPQISFVHISPKEVAALAKASNLSVDSIDISPSLLATERDVTISATVGNHGSEKCDKVIVAAFVDETEIERQELSISPETTSTIRSRWSPQRTGDHLIRIQILREDALLADNAMTSAIVVQEPIPILLVDGDRRGEKMQSETDFLRLALSPFSLLTGAKGDIFLSKTIQPNELNESILTNYRAVCLCNVRELNDVQQKALVNFVEKGNGLMVFLGDKVLTEQYQSWPTLAQKGLRIANFSKRKKNEPPKNEPEKKGSENQPSIPATMESELGPSSRIKMQQIEFAPIRELSSVSLNSLASVRFEYHSPIVLDPAALSNASDASTAMRFEDDQAWILESRIGKGRCLWVSGACDDDDSNLPTRSIYVPLMQKLAAYVCNAEPPTTQLVASDSWSRSLSGLTNKTDTSQEVQIMKPDGKVVKSQVNAEGQLRFTDTRLLGTYTGKIDGTETEKVLLACVKSKDYKTAKESTLAYLNADELTNLAASSNASIATGASDFLAKSVTDWLGREVWTWVWTLLLFCFLAEIALEQSLSPKVKSKPKLASTASLRGTTA